MRAHLYIFIAVVFVIGNLSAGAEPVASIKNSKAPPCPYPAEPINWISKYCGFVAGTDDEIAIMDSKCMKDAQSDLKSKDECNINKKYKTKTCEILIKNKYSKHKSINDCLKDSAVEPFFAGG